MIRRTLLLLLVLFLLSAAADWQHFKAQARPVLRPIVEWSEAASKDQKIAPADQSSSRSVEELLRSLDDIERPSTPTSQFDANFQHAAVLQRPPTSGIQPEDHPTIRERLRLVESALAEAQHEAQRLQPAVTTDGTSRVDASDLDRRRALLRERVLRLSALQKNLRQSL